MSNTLEYQARIKADAAELKKAQAELQKTGLAMSSVAQAGAGMTMAVTGASGALRGNVGALMQVAMGAGMVWQAFANLNPVLRLITIALGAASVVFNLFNRRQKEAEQQAEETKRSIDQLGLSMSDLDRHQQGVRDAADSFDRIERAATNAAAAIQRMHDAQLNFNRAASQATLSRIDHEEAVALADPNLTPEDRRRIQRDAAQQRAEEHRAAIEKEQEIKDRSFQSSITEVDRQRESDQARLAMLDNNVNQAESQFQGLRDSIAADIAGEQLDPSEIRRRRADGSMTFQESHDMRLRRNQADRFAGEWNNSPGRALALPYATEHLTDDRKNQISGFSQAVTSARRDREAFQADMPHREEERLNRISELEEDRRRQAEERSTAETRIDTGLVTLDSRHAAERKAEQEQEDASRKAEQEAVDRANRTAGQAERRYRFDQLDDGQQREIVEKAIERTRDKIAGSEGEAQAAHRMDLVAQLRERDQISGRIDSDEERAAADQAGRAGRHLEAIDQIRNSVSTRDMGLRDVFEHMNAVKSGQNPDEIVARNTQAIEEHMAAVKALLEETVK